MSEDHLEQLARIWAKELKAQRDPKHKPKPLFPAIEDPYSNMQPEDAKIERELDGMERQEFIEFLQRLRQEAYKDLGNSSR